MIDFSNLRELRERQRELDRQAPVDETVPQAFALTGLRHRDCEGLVEVDAHYGLNYCLGCASFVAKEKVY